MQDLRDEVKAALAEKSRTRAKQILKRSKRMEAAVERKIVILDNLDQVSLGSEDHNDLAPRVLFE